MKISLNEIKKLVDIPSELSDAELIKLIGARLVEVEGSEDWGPKYQGIKIVKVTTCEAIPDTHLHLCQVDAGTGSDIQVVCGAPNVRAGMFAAWIAPGCIVPETYGTADPFEIGARKLRGYESNGMLAAADELALGDDHDGIIELDPEMPGVKPGASFAEVFDLNDTILDIENKSLTHRPDTFGLVGFAREVAGILGLPFRDVTKNDDVKITNDIEITTDPELCERYSCAVMEFENAPHSKYFTSDDVFLIKAGMRPISPIVDVTNILMLKTGQPLHAFDYDKFVFVGKSATPKILVRAAKQGEKLELLDGKEIECDENDILITGNGVPVALAGAMGGKNTDIDENTKHIILESATFSLYHLRKTQMKHGIFSEAITRFTKGQPAGQTMNVLEEAVALLGGSGKLKSFSDCYPNPAKPEEIKVSVQEINALLGTDYSLETIVKTLENVGLKVGTKDDGLSIEIPYWRTDLHIKEDIIEEVGRLLGYDNIPLALPLRPFVGAEEDPLLKLKSRVRAILSDRLNAHEVLTYSFVSKNLIEKAGGDPENSYEIVNSISPELQCFRQEIVPSLLEKTAENLKAGYKDFTLYEINQVASKKDGLTAEKVPTMHTNLALVTLGDFYQAKAYGEELLRELGITTKTVPARKIPARILKQFKIETPVSAFELDLEQLLKDLPASSSAAKNLKFSRFPSVSRDVTFEISKETPYKTLSAALESAIEDTGLIYKIEPVSLYEPEQNLKNIQNVSFRLLLTSPDKTLNGAEISAIMERITKSVCQKVGGTVI